MLVQACVKHTEELSTEIGMSCNISVIVSLSSRETHEWHCCRLRSRFRPELKRIDTVSGKANVKNCFTSLLIIGLQLMAGGLLHREINKVSKISHVYKMAQTLTNVFRPFKGHFLNLKFKSSDDILSTLYIASVYLEVVFICSSTLT